jgi:hypothetical protein
MGTKCSFMYSKSAWDFYTLDTCFGFGLIHSIPEDCFVYSLVASRSPTWREVKATPDHYGLSFGSSL